MPQLLKERNPLRKKKSSHPVFGISLEDLVKYNNSESKIPDPVSCMFEFLRASGKELFCYRIELFTFNSA